MPTCPGLDTVLFRDEAVDEQTRNLARIVAATYPICASCNHAAGGFQGCPINSMPPGESKAQGTSFA